MSDLNWNEEATSKTPEIVYDEDQNKLTIEGKLIPEDPELFFDRLYNWTDAFIAGSKNTVDLDLYLYYYNTSSLKRISIYLSHLNDLVKKSNKTVKVIWKCDELDEDNISDGERLAELVDMKVEIVKVKEER